MSSVHVPTCSWHPVHQSAMLLEVSPQSTTSRVPVDRCKRYAGKGSRMESPQLQRAAGQRFVLDSSPLFAR